MGIQFCAIREVGTKNFVVHYEEQWGMGSTMTGPLTDTVYELSNIANVMSIYGSERLTMFETEQAAKDWIEKRAKQLRSFKDKQLEVVTFADLDTIVEHHLLDNKAGE